MWGNCVQQNPEYQHHSSTLAHVDSIKEVKCRHRVYKRQFERFVGAYSWENTNVMAVVGRPNMCGVPASSIIQNTSIIEAVWHKLRE